MLNWKFFAVSFSVENGEKLDEKKTQEEEEKWQNFLHQKSGKMLGWSFLSGKLNVT